MAAQDDPRARYRHLIDRLVTECRDGQGTVGPRRARAGVWNPNATDPDGPLGDQVEANGLLARLDEHDREVLAGLLAQQFVGGVHGALVVLHEEAISPFEDGYEGTPFHDFVGRLDGWEWPTRP